MSREKTDFTEKIYRETGIGDRLSNALNSLGYKKAIDFARKYDIKRSRLYSVLSGETKNPGSDFLGACRKAGINPNWLLNGEGEMLLVTQENNESQIKQELERNRMESQATQEGVVTTGISQGQELIDRLKKYAGTKMNLPGTKEVANFNRAEVLTLMLKILEKMDGNDLRVIRNMVDHYLEERSGEDGEGKSLQNS